MSRKNVGFHKPGVVELLRQMIGGDMHNAACAFADAREEYGPLHVNVKKAVQNYKRADAAMHALNVKDDETVLAYLLEEYAIVEKRIALWKSAPAHVAGREMAVLVFGMRKATLEEFLPPAYKDSRLP